jgi:PLP dependent protein
MRYEEVLGRVGQACLRAGREPSDVTVVGVSKTKLVPDIMRLYEMGHRDFGENRAQEMTEKAEQLPEDIRWHFIGTLQSNKARLVRPITHLLHSMDRASLGAAWMKGPGLPPPVLIQVNTGREPQKSGVLPEDATELLELLLGQGHRIRGVMAIPPPVDDPEEQRGQFRILKQVRDDLAELEPSVRELSMGMSDDFEVAIEEGASMIRVGRAIFGERT